MLDKDLDRHENDDMEMSTCTEEVVIGMEQGTTFPTKIDTSMCNALIDTGATKSCISERYYQILPLTKINIL